MIIPGSCGLHGSEGRGTRTALVFGHQVQKLKGFSVEMEHRRREWLTLLCLGNGAINSSVFYLSTDWAGSWWQVLHWVCLAQCLGSPQFRWSYHDVPSSSLETLGSLIGSGVLLHNKYFPLNIWNVIFISDKFEYHYLLSISELNKPRPNLQMYI